MSSVYNKDIPTGCSVCEYATICPGEMIICKFNGPVGNDGKCRKYRYDPIKRTPIMNMPDSDSGFEKDDFDL